MTNAAGMLIFYVQVSALQPHRKRYWLTPPPNNPAALTEHICTVCEVHKVTPALAAAGTHVTSTDEMTGIQAFERLHSSLPLLQCQLLF
jgi:hypothetical protein